ncbi:hypothetical protein OAU50_05235 [Planctomycetota bacterium]|nr:hypothetical protein [Planctomycetota bacterium]
MTRTPTILLLLAAVLLAVPAWAQRVNESVGLTENEGASGVEVQPVDPTPAEHAEIASLIELLSAGRMAQRDNAMVELAGYEGRALGQIREAKNHDDDEIAMRAEQLETVIEQRQGPLFLAARRLNLTIADLNSRLQVDDLNPLLNMLKSNAEAGMVPLWALIFRRLYQRNQIFMAAEICREIEGPKGYSRALARAASDSDLGVRPMSLINLSVLIPAETAQDAIDTTTALWVKLGMTGGNYFAFKSAKGLRGFFETTDILAALPVSRIPHPDLSSANAYPDMRTAVALSMIANCTSSEARDNRIPSVTSMSTMVLDVWLNLLARSRLTAEIENCLVQLIAAGAGTAHVKTAAAAWASVADQADVIALYPELSIAGQMAIVDDWWSHPRDAILTHKFAQELAISEQPWEREGGIQLLSQLQSPATILTLIESATQFNDTAHLALRALTNMAESLSAEQLEQLETMHSSANELARPPIIETLCRSNNADAHTFLKSTWKKWLPRSDLPFAVLVLSQDASTPIGAMATALIPRFSFDDDEEFSTLLSRLDYHDLTVIRSLLNMSNEEGFALLHEMAADETARWRNLYVLALALAGQDGDLISDWIKRLTREVSDPRPDDFRYAVAASRTPDAETFRKSVFDEGKSSDYFTLVFWSAMLGHSTGITTENMREKVFASNDGIGYYGRTCIRLQGELTETEALKYATYMLSTDASDFLSMWYIHVVQQSGVNALKAMFGTSENPTPRDNNQILATALLGDKERAQEIIKAMPADKTGDSFQTIQIARAWLGLCDSPEIANRVCRMYGANPNNTFGQVLRMRNAELGDITALRELLDAAHPHNGALSTTDDLPYLTLNAGRWGDVEVRSSASFDSAMNISEYVEPISLSLFVKNLKSAPEREWHRWWQANRGRVAWNSDIKQFELTELP